MCEFKTFEIEEKLNSADEFYNYLLNNVEFTGKSMGIKIENFSKDNPFCIIGKEKNTGKNILLFASKSPFPECLEELSDLSEALDFDTIVFFAPKTNKNHIQTLKWLEKICNSDIQLFVKEVDFEF